jgi:hypothetical protein
MEEFTSVKTVLRSSFVYQMEKGVTTGEVEVYNHLFGRLVRDNDIRTRENLFFGIPSDETYEADVEIQPC